MTRFSVACIASSKVHSAFVAGLERGNTIGCLFSSAIRRSTSLVNAPGIEESPISLRDIVNVKMLAYGGGNEAARTWLDECNQ